ncbi:hypothetical protein WJX77_009700 [Trebouxia sp. C0004]
MVVMRHALRLDEVDDDFVSSSKAWWDPPLAPKGFDQAAHTAETHLRSLDLQVLVTSPFKRCLQTANTALESMPTCCKRMHINCKLCEMLTARNLNFHDRPLPNGHIQEWMWNGSSIDAALKLALLSDNFIIDDSDLPAFPETAELAHARINVALEAIGNQYMGKNILVVAHGEAVNRSVVRLMPWTNVIDAQHCSAQSASPKLIMLRTTFVLVKQFTPEIDIVLKADAG